MAIISVELTDEQAARIQAIADKVKRGDVCFTEAVRGVITLGLDHEDSRINAFMQSERAKVETKILLIRENARPGIGQ